MGLLEDEASSYRISVYKFTKMIIIMMMMMI